jgi:hypothetical protein
MTVERSGRLSSNFEGYWDAWGEQLSKKSKTKPMLVTFCIGRENI